MNTSSGLLRLGGQRQIEELAGRLVLFRLQGQQGHGQPHAAAELVRVRLELAPRGLDDPAGQFRIAGDAVCASAPRVSSTPVFSTASPMTASRASNRFACR